MSLSNLCLDAFMAICKHSTVLEASRHLGLTQTGVTQRIRALEKDLGATLFLRSRKGMKLTEAGRKLEFYCRQKLDLEESVLGQIRGEGIDTPLRLKVRGSTFLMQSRVLGHLPELRKQFPRLYLDLQISDDEDRLEALKLGLSDFVFLPKEEVPLEMDSKVLRSSKYVLVGPRGARTKKNYISEASILDFSERDSFTTLFFKHCRISYDRSRERHYVNNTLMFPQLIEEGLGMAVLDEQHFKLLQKNYALENVSPERSYTIDWALVWQPRTELPAYFKALIKLVQ